MTAPPLAATGRNGHRVYAWPPPPAQGIQVPSVTAVISGGIPKAWLGPWAAKQAAVHAAANRERLAGLPEAAAVAEIKAAPWANRARAATLGDAVHAQINARLTRATVLPSLPEGIRATHIRHYLNAFTAFDRDFQPRWLASEQTVFNLTHGYAGTLDVLCDLDGLTTLLDIKTGRNVHPEVALQLAAYANAEFIGTPDGRQHPLPKVEAAAVLHLRPEGYVLRAVRCDAEVFAVFLAALTINSWATDLSAGVLGRPLPPSLPAGGGEAW